MPADCCAPDYDLQFDEERARRDLLDYRQGGPDDGTRRLVAALIAEGVEGASLLDIGGGIGAIQLELLAAGVSSSLDVDASGPFLATAETEARERGFADRARYLHGDFVAVAEEVDDADIVTLDRVICCYPHVEPLVRGSVARARRLYGLVYPRDAWWVRLMMRLGNLSYVVFRNDFRVHVHRQATIDRILADAGMVPVWAHTGFLWRTAVWRRRPA
jgi:SAM-dependent methyltransferase